MKGKCIECQEDFKLSNARKRGKWDTTNPDINIFLGVCSRSGYAYGCRCSKCTECNKKASKLWIYKKNPNRKPKRKRQPHGTRSMYQICRDGDGGMPCMACRSANTAYINARRKNLPYDPFEFAIHDPIEEELS